MFRGRIRLPLTGIRGENRSRDRNPPNLEIPNDSPRVDFVTLQNMTSVGGIVRDKSAVWVSRWGVAWGRSRGEGVLVTATGLRGGRHLCLEVRRRSSSLSCQGRGLHQYQEVLRSVNDESEGSSSLP